MQSKAAVENLSGGDFQLRAGNSPTSITAFPRDASPAKKFEGHFVAKQLINRQVACLRQLFTIYADKVFDDQHPTRLVNSLSSEGWRCFCRDVLRGGPSGKPLVPLIQLAKMFDAHASRRRDHFPPTSFRAESIPPRRADPRHMPFEVFLELLGLVAVCWANSRRKIRGGLEAFQPLSAMLNEAAVSSFHQPGHEA
eukprot:6170699-Pleurochrysis_carterae.AAC.7